MDQTTDKIEEKITETAGEISDNTEMTDKAENTEEKDLTTESDPESTEVNAAVQKERKRTGKRRGPAGYAFSFILGVALCFLIMHTASGALGLGRYVSDSEWEYYNGLSERFWKFYEIEEMIESDPLAEYSPEEINDEQLKEIVKSTGDPYAQYYTSEEFAEFEKQFLTDYVGIGVGVAEVDGRVIVRTVMPDGPAAEGGMEPGDYIVKVDGKKVKSVDEAVSMLTGKPGTEVRVIVERDGKELELVMTREKIELESVAYKELEDHEDVGYIRITTFRKGTDDDFKQAVEDLEDEGCDRFIIDLRDNGGGLTSASIEIADYLLPSCTIMTDVSKDGGETVYSSDASSAGIEYVFLVNENTASASEILAGAVQDNSGGKIIGHKTFGKGVTQVTHKFYDGSAVKLTETEYYRPNGDKVHGIGITPDIEADDGDMIDKAVKELDQ